MSIHLDADHPAIRVALAQAAQDAPRRAVVASEPREREKRPRARGKRGSGPEQALQNAILDYLHAHGILAWRINSGAIKAAHGGLVRLAPKGHSDLFALWHGTALFIEIKTAKGKLSADQEAFLQAVRAAGAVAFVARSVDDIAQQLAALEAMHVRAAAIARAGRAALGIEERP